MNFLKNNRNRLSLLLVSFLLILIPLYLYGCGNSSYKTAKELDAKINVLISPETLYNWITNGYSEDKYGYNKIVILFIGTPTEYSAGHIPGSYFINRNSIHSIRSDGVSDTRSMVATKGQMDAIIQSTGIDGGTVIVLTGPSGNGQFMFLSRAYFDFRYWGFPRPRVRVLDGFVNTTWTSAGYSLSTEFPSGQEPSTYSVCNLTPDPDRFRAPLEEMITIAEDDNPKTVIVDTRSPAQYAGTAIQGKVAFGGHIKTAVHMNYTGLLEGGNGKLIPKSDLEAAMAAIGVDSTTTAYPYCQTSWRAAITFLALDGVLNYPVKLYDGAWIEWGQMTEVGGNGFGANSPWKTDTLTRSGGTGGPGPGGIYYYDNTGSDLASLTVVNSYALRADGVNREDASICAGGGGDGDGGDAGGY